MSAGILAPVDARLAAIHDLLARLAAGDFTARGLLSNAGDALNQILDDLNHLAVTLDRQHATIAEAEQRSDELLDVMMQMAAGDYSKRVSVRESDTLFDGLAAGLNMLADEFVAAQQDRVRLQEEIIQTQAAVIQELSLPLIPINNDILVMPLIGTIDTARAQQVLERLLEGVATKHSQAVILDSTGVAVVDRQVANTLVRAAQAVQLLGRQMILTGIRPEVAQTLRASGARSADTTTPASLPAGRGTSLPTTRGDSLLKRAAGIQRGSDPSGEGWCCPQSLGVGTCEGNPLINDRYTNRCR